MSCEFWDTYTKKCKLAEESGDEMDWPVGTDDRGHCNDTEGDFCDGYQEED